MKEISIKEAVAFMLKQFKPERYTYLSVSIVSFILLVISVILFMNKNEMTEKNIGCIAGMLGSGGAIAYSASQILRMWRDCINLFEKSMNTKDEKNESK